VHWKVGRWEGDARATHARLALLARLAVLAALLLALLELVLHGVLDLVEKLGSTADSERWG
jgi:hypothetical protein